MARGDWNTVSGSTNNNNYWFTGIRWRYRDDLFGTSGYPSSRIESNTDIIEYQPYTGKKNSSVTSNYYVNWLTSYYKYSYNTTSGEDPGSADNQLNVSTTFRYDKATTNTTYYLTKGSLSSTNPMNTSSSSTSRIIQVPHCSDGTSKLRLYFYFAGNSNTSFRYAETNAIVTLDTIPRYTSITNFAVSKRNETSFTFNWSTADTIDYAWYSTDNGSNWTGYDVTDGTSGSFTVSGLSPNTTYQCKLRVRRKDSQLTTDSSVVSQTTNAVPSQSFRSKTETTISMNWSCDANADYIWYSTNNGSSWTAVGSVSGTSGYYTISGLTANTSYNIKTRIRRSATQTTYDTSASSQTTYQYPYVSAVSSTNLTIGNSQTLTLYNPMGRTCTVYMKKDSASGTQLYSGTTNTTTITFTPVASTLYSSIPNTKYGNCVYYCVYDNHHVSTSTGNTYIVNEAINAPELSSSSLTDTNSVTIALTGSNSKIVLNASTLLISVTASPKNSATISSITIDGSSRTVTNNTATLTISNPATSSFVVVITDSRGISAQTTVSIASANIVDYIPLTIVGSGKRNQPTDGKINISSSGKYFNGSFGAESNTLTTEYNWREAGGSWQENWIPLTNTTSTGTHTEPQIQLSDFDYTKNYEFQFRAKDKIYTGGTIVSTITVPKGMPIFNWDNDEFNVNGTLKIDNRSIKDYITDFKRDADGWIMHTWRYSLGECFKKMTITLGSTSGNYGTEGSLYWAYAEFDLPQNWFNSVPITTVTIAKQYGRGAYYVIDPVGSTKNKIKGWVYSSRDIHGEDADFYIHCIGL